MTMNKKHTELRQLESGETPKITKDKDPEGYPVNEFGEIYDLCPAGYWREPMIDHMDVEENKKYAKRYEMTLQEWQESEHLKILLGCLEGEEHEVLYS